MSKKTSTSLGSPFDLIGKFLQKTFKVKRTSKLFAGKVIAASHFDVSFTVNVGSIKSISVSPGHV